MMIKICALLFLATLAVGHDISYITLTKEVVNNNPFLKCEARILNGGYALKMSIYQVLEDDLIEVATLGSDGIYVKHAGIVNDTLPEGYTVYASGNFSVEASIPFLTVSKPDQGGIPSGDYRCDLTYMMPHRHYDRVIIHSDLLAFDDNAQIVSITPSENKDVKMLDIRQMIWPVGDFSLLKTRYGCPKYDLSDWDVGTRRHVLESIDTNQNENKTADHMPLDLFFKESNWYLSNMSYCSRPASYPGVPFWPYGTYCIHRKNGFCPEGFFEGSILFDDEDDTNGMNREYGVLPDGVYNWNTKYFYCCRKDQKHDQEILLPIQEPFYLYRYQGKCQKVAGMKVTEDYIVFDTANDSDNRGKNIDKQTGDYPDSLINNVRLELCYYEKAC